MKDPNVIQIRDEFYLAKRQYELQPELLGDLTVRSLYHSLMNIRTIAQLEQWLETIEKSDYSYDSQTEISDTEYGNILGEIAHTASELNKEQRQEAVKVFKTLGPVDVRVIDYATDKFKTIINQKTDYHDELVGITLRNKVMLFLTAEEVETLNKFLEVNKEEELPSEIRDYLDFVRTLSDSEKEALLINNSTFGVSEKDYYDFLAMMADQHGYCVTALCKSMQECGTDGYYLITPKELSFQIALGISGTYQEEKIVRIIRVESDKIDIWLSTGRCINLWGEGGENANDPDIIAAQMAVGDYLATTRHQLKKKEEENAESTENPVIAYYDTVKNQHPQDIVILKQDSYYETFGDDAISCAEMRGLPLWFRAKGYLDLTATVVLTDKDVMEIRKKTPHTFVTAVMKEKDDEDLGLQSCFLNIYLDNIREPMSASVIKKQDGGYAVRGTFRGQHLPAKDLGRFDCHFIDGCHGTEESRAAVLSLFLLKNLKEIKTIKVETE